MSNLTRRQFLRVSALATAGAALAACGKKATTAAPTAVPVAGATAKPVEKATATPAGPQRPTTWPIGDVPRNRRLEYYWSSAPAAGRFNPYVSGWDHQNGSAIIYEPCAFYAILADKEILWLAESYKYSTDAKECTITFRKGIKWSDGTAFSAKDVVWCMDTLKRVKGLDRQSVYMTELDKVEAIDDTTLKVTLNQVDWRFFFKSLTFRYDLGDDTAVLPPQMFAGVADADLLAFKAYDTAKGWPISTGAYGVSESTDTVTNYDLRPTWWAVETGLVKDYPAPWRITQTLFTNDTIAAQKLINKEIDQSLDLRPFVVASTLNQAEHLTTWTGRKPPYGYLDWWPISVQFCTLNPSVNTPNKRWAIAYAIDQQKVVDIGWGGAGTVANAPFPNYPKLVALMDTIKDITDKYNVLEYNLEKSAALMTQEGYTKDNQGFWVDAEGKRPDVNLWAGVPLFGDIAPIVSQQLQSAGFDCQHKAPPDVWAGKTDGRASLFLYGHGGSTIDPLDTFNLYRKSNFHPLGENAGGNITRWYNEDFEAVANEMNNTAMDDPKMKDLFRRGMEIYYRELPDCPLVQWYHRIPLNTWYFDNWPNQENPYMNSALWHLTMLQVVLGLKATGKT